MFKTTYAPMNDGNNWLIGQFMNYYPSDSRELNMPKGECVAITQDSQGNVNVFLCDKEGFICKAPLDNCQIVSNKNE